MSDTKRIPGITILVVEDEHFLRHVMVEFLTDAGCAVVEAATGERAIYICHSDAPIDVVFTDIQLPGAASGFDVAETFRAARVNMPIVYTSGNSNNRDRCVPGSLFFQKPYRVSEVLNACLRLQGLYAKVA